MVGIWVNVMRVLLIRLSILLNMMVVRMMSGIGMLGMLMNSWLVRKVVRFIIDLMERLMLWVMMMIVCFIVMSIRIDGVSRRLC